MGLKQIMYGVTDFALNFVRNHAAPDDLVDKSLRTDGGTTGQLVVFHGGQVVCREEVYGNMI